MAKIVDCRICGYKCSHMAKHVKKAHPEEYCSGKAHCIRLYRSGLTVEQIAVREDVIFDNKMTVSRIIREFISPEQISENRHIRASNSLSKAAKHQNSLARASVIGGKSSAQKSVIERLRALVEIYNEHLPILASFATELGFDFDPSTGIIHDKHTKILIIPNVEYFSKYKFLARDFYADASDSRRSLILFLDELILKRNLIKSMISAKTGTGALTRVGARLCQLVELSPGDARAFFDENHISGHTGGNFYIGLKYDGDIIAALSTRTPFIKKYKNTIEIARFAVKSGYIVGGAFSRLLKFVKLSFNSRYEWILSYCDLRYGDGGVYLVNGFDSIGCTQPDYFYTDGRTRHHRFRYRARAGMSEHEVALQAGVYPFFGVGSRIFLCSTR